jgi:hypothetical protein
MPQPLFQQVDRLFRMGLIALVVVLGSRVQVGRATTQSSMRPTLITQVFDVTCTSLAAVSSAYSKLGDLAGFTVQSPDSVVEIIFNGRIAVDSFENGSRAMFELRVDNNASNEGRARAQLRAAEAGQGGLPVSITALFTGLQAGEHTASIWVRTLAGDSGNQAMVNPGCSSTDVLIVKEYTPFGFIHLPAIMKQ